MNRTDVLVELDLLKSELAVAQAELVAEREARLEWASHYEGEHASYGALRTMFLSLKDKVEALAEKALTLRMASHPASEPPVEGLEQIEVARPGVNVRVGDRGPGEAEHWLRKRKFHAEEAKRGGGR
jgi:hypothetical protein